MKDYPCERLYRDARITNIYEGTTQLQVVAAIRYVWIGTYLNQIKAYQDEELNPELDELKARLIDMTETYEQLVVKVADTKDNEYIDFHSRRLVECAGHIIIAYLLLSDANRMPEEFRCSAEVYINHSEAEVKKIREFIEGFSVESLKVIKINIRKIFQDC